MRSVVRNLLRRSIGTRYTPDVLARFGSGRPMVEIRRATRSGSAARFEQALRADERTRLVTELLSNRRIAESAAAERPPGTGRADSRIFATLARPARLCGLTILGFGAAPGPAAG